VIQIAPEMPHTASIAQDQLINRTKIIMTLSKMMRINKMRHSLNFLSINKTSNFETPQKINIFKPSNALNGRKNQKNHTNFKKIKK
jgi:hypothetical protein